jgi:peptidoglycan/LPS O-acetylase OafA/YrhL
VSAEALGCDRGALATSRPVAQNLEWLQALRGIAAVLVVMTHARTFLHGTPWQPFVEQYLRPGAQGVDLFFMVSGFIMVYTTRNADGSATYAIDFMIKRIARIWPVYAVAVCAWIALELSFAKPIAPFPAVIRSLLFLPVSTTQPPYLGLPFGLGWTLNYECYFYLVFALSTLVVRWRWIAFSVYLASTLIVLPLSAVGYVSFMADNDYRFASRILNQVTNPIIWEFAMGVVAGRLFLMPFAVPRTRLWGALVIACAGLLVNMSVTGMVDNHGPIGWGAPMALLFFAITLACKQSEPRVPRSLVWLGDISYSLYLMHFIVFTFVAHLFAALGAGPKVHTVAFVICVFPLPFFAAGLSRRYVENGISLRFRRRLLSIHAHFVSPIRATPTV